MKKTLFAAYLALFAAFLLPYMELRSLPEEEDGPGAPRAAARPEEAEEENKPRDTGEKGPEEPSEEGGIIKGASPMPEKIKLLDGDRVLEVSTEEYIIGVLAAEMPAEFPAEALKAQAVAARSFALCRAAEGRHAGGELCSDPGCCQAWADPEELRESWGGAYEENYKKIASAAAETEGQYLSYEGEPALAVFHSSSAGATESSAALWSPRPYLISVPSPEGRENVPNFVSSLRCAPIDFRDCILSLHPEADLSGEESEWLGGEERDESGRVSYALIGGIKISGPELRELFSLRSASFELSYEQGSFIFMVRGFGHGVGMSQYGARLMAEKGADYAEILAHYYPGTRLTA